VTNVSLKLVICATLSLASLKLSERAIGKETADRSDEGKPLAAVKNQAATQAAQKSQVTQKEQTAQKSQAAQMGKTQKAQPSEQNNQALAVYKKAEAYRAVLETDTAISQYTIALKLDPHLDRAHLGRALCYLDSEDYRSAVTDLEQVNKTSAVYNQALHLAGMAHYHLQEYAAARANYDNLLLPPENAADIAKSHTKPEYAPSGALIFRAQCSVMLKMPESAIKDATLALQQVDKKSLQRGWAFRARARAHVELHQYDAALADYADALALVKQRKDLGLVETIGGSLTPDKLLQERAKLYDELGKHDLARKDRDDSKVYVGKLMDDAPFRLHDK
jgi:hypothetical protein